MIFSSFTFLFRFLPIFLIAYYLTKPAYRSITVFLGSLIFYAFGEPLAVPLLLISIVGNHAFARRITIFHRIEERRGKSYAAKRRQYLLLDLCFNLGLLFLFRYLNFFFEIVNTLTQTKIFGRVGLTTPLGMCFFTLQAISYVVDVYRGECRATKSMLDFAAYLTMFPKLLCGPLVKYRDIRKDMRRSAVNFSEIEFGVATFILGFSCKVLLADNIAGLWKTVETAGAAKLTTPAAWLGSWGYSMQLYFDFFGYSLMAVGLGLVLGFHLPENFDEPYFASSVTEFWRRWHITLYKWFRVYVYQPLGGNKKGALRFILNTFVVWLLTCLWHGGSLNFVIWALFLFALMMLERFYLLRTLKRSPVFARIYMLIYIPVSWMMFHFTETDALGAYLKRMFFLPVADMAEKADMLTFGTLCSEYWWLLLICAVCASHLPYTIVKRHHDKAFCKLLLFGLFWLSVYQVTKTGTLPFLYFQF